MADDKNDQAKAALPPLDTEAATRQQDPWSAGFMGLVATNDPLLTERGDPGSMAFEIYRDLKRDGKVFSGLQKRKLAVVSREWTVQPLVDSDEGRRDAKIVTDILGGFAFDRLCAGLLDALIVGWQPAEIVWTLRELPLEGGGTRQMVVPDRVPKRLQRRFVYRDVEAGLPAELRLLTRDAMQDGVPVHPRKFIVHTAEAEDDNPYGAGLGLQLYWPVFFKRKGVLSWNKLSDRFGTPTPWGKYPREATPREKGTLFDALRAFSNDGMLMTPEGISIELLEARMSATGATPNQSLIEYMDDWISEVLLGQPPRKGGGGALAAAASEREGVRLELSQADSDLLSETLNRTLLAWICDYNGLQPCQVYRKIEAEADTKALAETDKTVSEMGFRPTIERIRTRFGEGWEERPTTTEPPNPGLARPGQPPASFAEGGSPDPVASAVEALEHAAAPGWQRVVDDLQALVGQAGSTDEVRGLIARQYGALDTADLTRLLAAAFALAELKGMDAARAEGGDA